MSNSTSDGQAGELSAAVSQQQQRQQRLRESPVRQFFDGRSIFITGASGFIGRVLLEKLLRCYPNIKSIYILMRPKKNQSPHDRLHKQLLNVPIFDRVRSMKDPASGRPLLDKLRVVPGDIGDAWLGMSEPDLSALFADESLSIVFHSAATIKFDEPLRVSAKLNLIATQTVLEFCKRLPNLVSLCHVSTAYTNSNIKDNSPIEERIYPINGRPEDLIKLCELLDEDLMQQLKMGFIRERPNTYTYTKALAEQLIVERAAGLPVAIVRPTIVVASWREPMPGWVDNLNGPTGLLLAIGKGLLRSMHTLRGIKADIIPVDVVVNTMIASAYYAARAHNKFRPIEWSPSPVTPQTGGPAPPVANGTANGRAKPTATATANNNNNIKSSADETTTTTTTTINDHQQLSGHNHEEEEEEPLALPKPPVFHINSGDLNPITWGCMEDFCMPIIRNYPSCQVLRYPYGSFKSNRWHDLITRLFVHYLPALIIDLLCLLMGKKRQLLSIYFKLHAATAALSHFSTQNYNFKTKNLAKLRAILNEQDSEELFMDIENLDYRQFWSSYVLGCRRYILKESDDSLEQARKSFRRSYYIEIGFRLSLLVALLACIVIALKSYGLSAPPICLKSLGLAC